MSDSHLLGRILIVEDDDPQRQILERHLRKSGHTILAVESAEAALNSITEFGPDLVLSDVRMGGMSGYDLLDRIGGGEQFDVVLMTAYEGVSGAIGAMKSGAFDYLIKPLDLDELEAMVEASLRHRRDVANASRKTAEPIEAPENDRTIVGSDPAMLGICKLIGRVADTPAPVLVRGETGTGKELIARALHENSNKRAQPFIAVDCTAIPETLLESSLFGHVAGAFTGAKGPQRGRFEMAGTGTIFLDEIGDTSMGFQAKLLRVLQEREFYPVGSETPRRTEARVVAATHRNLDEMVKNGEFREDLYFRLRVVEIFVPPLRERRSDIPLLVQHLLAKRSRELGRPVPTVPDSVLKALRVYEWPGNVRELENALMRALMLASGPAIQLEDLALGQTQAPAPAWAQGSDQGEDRSLEGVERSHVQRVLVETAGNKSAAARLLRVSRPRLDRIIEKYELHV